MKTLYFTKSELAILPKLYATEHIKPEDKMIQVKLFHPASNWTWYVIEFDGSDICWGFVKGLDAEFGYFSLSEISQVRGPLGLCVERDKWFKPMKVSDIPSW